MSAARGRYVVGVDVGGTCTDSVVIDRDGAAVVGKAYSTPDDFSEGILESVGVAAGELGSSLEELLAESWLFLHSTTVAENAISNMNLARAALITTSGFRDTLFATRGSFGRWSGLTEDEKRNPIATGKAPPLVPRERIATVKERVDREGAVCVPLGREDVEQAVRAVLELDVDAVGVCLLWSFANPEHELAIREELARHAPGLFVTLSHELAPVVGEYERTSTVALNACLGPVIHGYLETLRARLEGRGFAGTLLVMQAHGGLLSVSRARERPVGMIESGPVSGLLGSRKLGDLVGVRNIISADVGGTTFKVGVVREGLIDYQHESQVFRYHYALPKMDVASLGVAGGSIVSFDERTGIPQVGPRSAGSYPGPVVYGHGGTEITVTDVDVILGFMNPAYFLGGRESFDVDAAQAAFETQVAERLGLPPLEAAGAIYRLANAYIFDLLHRTTVQRGLDPRVFALFSTGGTAGMHLPAIGAELGVRQVVVPYTASVHGAFGLPMSDVVHEELLTRPMRHPADPAEVTALFTRLEEHVREQLASDGFSDEEIDVTRSVDMHYVRQVHEVTVPLRDEGAVTAAGLDQLAADFKTLYEQRYGPESTWPGARVELVTFRVRGAGRLRGPELRPLQRSDASADEAFVETREVFLPADGLVAPVPAYDFELLGVGTSVTGPALIWSPITTVFLGSRQGAVVDPYRNLLIETTAGDGDAGIAWAADAVPALANGSERGSR